MGEWRGPRLLVSWDSRWVGPGMVVGFSTRTEPNCRGLKSQLRGGAIIHEDVQLSHLGDSVSRVRRSENPNLGLFPQLFALATDSLIFSWFPHQSNKSKSGYSLAMKIFIMQMGCNLISLVRNLICDAHWFTPLWASGKIPHV